jgi:predicted transcriptional regulator
MINDALTATIENKEISNALEEFRREAAKPDNLFLVVRSGLTFVSLWNPLVSSVFQAVLSAVQIGINTHSRDKAERRIIDIIETIERIWRRQQTGETNYEAALICPELFRNALIIEDENRVKEHLAFIEMLFISDKFNFDDLAETLRLVNQLSSVEYKILKLIPTVETKWKQLLEIKEISVLFDTQKQRLIAALLSLINMNLVVRKLVIRHDGGPELGIIKFDDDHEYIRLSAYGQLFLETMDEIRANICLK